MRSRLELVGVVLAVASLVAAPALADEPLTLENVVSPGPNLADEPLGKYSPEKALRFLDAASLDWQKSRKCFACHTNYLYLMARPLTVRDAALSKATPAPAADPTANLASHAAVRAFAEELVSKRWEDKGPRWDAEVGATAVALAVNDSLTTGKLHPLTRKALDRMWTTQREDGGFTWLKCDWPPMESDDEFGAVFALVGVALAPENYRDTPAAKAGVEKIRGYLRGKQLLLHHRLFVLWASTVLSDLLTADERQKLLDEVGKLQQADGGWSIAALGDWKRGDGTPQTADSDGYATGMAIYLLRKSGRPANDPAIERGVAWLKGHQRDSGRWFARSLHKDNKHFLTHAASAWAVMALAECGQLR